MRPGSSYDAVGRFRTKLPSGEAVDASVTLALGGALEGRVSGAVDLGKRLAATPATARCLSARLMSSAISQPIGGDDCAAAESVARAGFEGGRLADLVRAVATSPALFVRGKGATP